MGKLLFRCIELILSIFIFLIIVVEREFHSLKPEKYHPGNEWVYNGYQNETGCLWKPRSRLTKIKRKRFVFQNSTLFFFYNTISRWPDVIGLGFAKCGTGVLTFLGKRSSILFEPDLPGLANKACFYRFQT